MADTVTVNVWFGDERDVWWFEKPDAPSAVEQGDIEIPSDVVGNYFALRDRLDAEVRRLRSWLDTHIESHGGEDYEAFLRGELTEPQMRARIAGCEHKNRIAAASRLPRCEDCGRYILKENSDEHE